uniref:EF-hand domain-containing protein n=1 Tax=Arion vulgaris TaxID=1028688 RepID=A0A0B7B7U9_9EUPU
MLLTELPKFLTTTLIVHVLVCCLLTNPLIGSPTNVEKRDTRRYPRAKYRVGYMFGKRSDEEPTSSTLFDIVSRFLLTRKELESLISKNPQILSEVSAILDRDDDGYISASDIM